MKPPKSKAVSAEVAARFITLNGRPLNKAKRTPQRRRRARPQF